MTTHYIIGDIDGDTVKAVHEALAEDTQQIDIYIHSYGGVASAGFAIYDLIKNDPRVGTHLLGVACSAASLIFLGGQRTRTATEHSRFMAHRGSTRIGYATIPEMADVADIVSQFVDEPLAAVYEPYLTKKQMKRFLDGEDVSLDVSQMSKQGMLK